MAQVGIEGLTAGDAEDHRAQDDHAVEVVFGKKGHGIPGVQGPQDFRSSQHLEQAQNRQGAKPE